MKTIIKHAIILPLKENFSSKESGAVSIWVNSYLKKTNFRNNIHIFCSKLHKSNYLSKKNLNIIDNKSKLFSNYSYIKKISDRIVSKNLYSAEVHNRPEYAKFLLKNTNLKVNLIFHNDPNSLRDSDTTEKKNFLLNNCNKIIFVSEYLRRQFFKNLNIKHKNNVEIVGNAIDKLKKFPKKKNLIIFSGKLNKSKGYNVFGKSIIRILNKNNDWKAVAIGNEPREKYNFKHKNFKILNWLEHSKLLKFFEKAAISVVNPTWQEPFGRTAMESASRGCAVITSISGGLQETFNNNLILKKNNTHNLIKKIQFLIDDKKKLNSIQKLNFKNVVHDIDEKSKILDNLIPVLEDYNSITNKNLRILHVSTFGERLDHRIFNLSISSKISKGLIRNNFDVINFDYRDYSRKKIFNNSIDDKILSIVMNYRPHLVIFGHNNILKRETLLSLKNNFKSKVIIWYEDALAKGGPDYKYSQRLLEKNHDIIDKYFITTHPSALRTKISKEKIHFMPVPVDQNIESENFYEKKKSKDLFFALSHGVNFGKLKRGSSDDREKFIEKLIFASNGMINFNILGLFEEQPKWNYDLNSEIMKSKIALNLSRGKPVKYYSSNRIATLMGNGCLTAIDQRVGYSDFFSKKEMIFYKNEKDLVRKILKIKDNKNLLIKIAKNGKKKYFKLFSNLYVSQFLIDKTFSFKNKYNYKWT